MAATGSDKERPRSVKAYSTCGGRRMEAGVVLAGLQFFLSGFVLPGALADLGDHRPEQAALLAVALLLAAASLR